MTATITITITLAITLPLPLRVPYLARVTFLTLSTLARAPGDGGES